ncbi:MAG: tRNA (N6-threonylcarbamoyladenosine(37)-N6)-methyltransferase TrmO [Desulfobacteraceae bacterium]|nr:tRNA (N6-threonylcarbamoyladenosine(37)-N6)-methyltransferase TrmO [Desulfobacteraceae bacterium]
MDYSFSPIGKVHSCFSEKFGIPRQAGLVAEASACIELLPPYDNSDCVRELSAFTHIWVVFVFHEHINGGWRPTVRPPRLGGNKRIGVFAARSPFRPNPIGLSAVKLDRITFEKNQALLHISGVDMLDGTPVLDIKPYVPYADCLPSARGGFAKAGPDKPFQVDFSPNARSGLKKIEQNRHPRLGRLIRQLLRSDPRPAYYKTKPKKNEFGTRLFDVEVKWRVEGKNIIVTAVEQG